MALRGLVRTQTVTCVDCQKDTHRLARGLCSACYYVHKRAGTINKFPTVQRSVLVEEYEHLSQWGMSMEEIAARLGVKEASLKTALGRHARARTQ